MFVVIATSPDLDTSRAVGPFRTEEKAGEVWHQLLAMGYNPETVKLQRLSDLDPASASE